MSSSKRLSRQGYLSAPIYDHESVVINDAVLQFTALVLLRLQTPCAWLYLVHTGIVLSLLSDFPDNTAEARTVTKLKGKV